VNLDELVQQSHGAGLAVAEAKPSDSRLRDLEMILNVVRKINTSLVLSDVLELVLDEAIRITNAERGFITLADKERKLEFVTGRNGFGECIHAESFEVSSSVLNDVFTTGESLCVEDALNDGRFERRQSIVNLELETIICSPLRTPEETLGVIYLDSKYIQPVDKADILFLFEILAGQAAIAIKNARLYQDLKSTYEDLKNANEQIIKSERMAMKGEIAGQVSHELRNIVALVMLQLGILKRKLDKISPEELRDIVEKTLAGARRIQGFSDSLLTSRRAAGTMLPANPNVVCRDFFDFIKVLPKFKHNELSLVLGEHVPDIQMDIDQVQQVLLNLVNNAVEAFADAAITLQTEYNVVDDAVRISVHDDGPGIDEAIRNKLLVENITTKVDGHGYGLPICRQIVEHHAGTIHIESQKDRGAKFIMTFPVPAQSITCAPIGTG
jgi:two-component system sensor histidine kinase HydH